MLAPSCQLISTTVETLTPIWQRVLERFPIGAEENFFDLGGSDSSADLLFTEIALVFGRRIPSVTIVYAPTIAALAILLQQPTLPAFPPIVQMKLGSEKPPICIVHGLGGSTAELFNVVGKIQTKHPIYGIQAKGIDGLQEPLERVEDMTSFYLAALEDIEPRGPYILIGYSFGGLVALEMAQQLAATRKHVVLLVLLDTYPDERFLTSARRLSLIAQRVKLHIEGIRQLSLSGAVEYFFRKFKARRRRFTSPPKSASGARLSFAQAALRVEHSAYVAMANYRPKFYHGKVNFVAAAETRSFFLPPDPLPIWGDLTEQFELDTIPGDQSEMVNVQCENLASILSRHIQAATSEILQSRQDS